VSSTITLHSIQPLGGSTNSRPGWRIASAIVPATVADLTITREETRELTPARILLLETIRFLEQENGRVSVRDLTAVSGIGDEALMSGILAPLDQQQQNLIIVEGENVRQNPALTIDGAEARITVEREEQVCVLGSPPLPTHGIDRERFRQLRAFESSSTNIPVDAGTLEVWRTSFWDSRTQRLQLKEPLRPRLYVLESANHVETEFVLRDDQQRLRISLSGEHPFVHQLHAQARPILGAISAVLSPFGSWNHAGELRCNGEQWRRWRAADGHEMSEVILRGDIDVAVGVRCRPADQEAAQAMFLENVLAGLDAKSGPCTAESLETMTARQRQSPLLRDYNLAMPTLGDVGSAAWESGRWELAYRIAAPTDGLS
jgi:hypothetical protein